MAKKPKSSSENADNLMKVIKSHSNPFQMIAQMLDKAGIKAEEFGYEPPKKDSEE